MLRNYKDYILYSFLMIMFFFIIQVFVPQFSFYPTARNVIVQKEINKYKIFILKNVNNVSAILDKNNILIEFEGREIIVNSNDKVTSMELHIFMNAKLVYKYDEEKKTGISWEYYPNKYSKCEYLYVSP
jgi:hypothetical protein